MYGKQQQLRRARPLLGTLVDLHISFPDSVDGLALIESGFAAITRIHQLMSFHEADSDLSRLNQAPPDTPVTLQADTLAVLDIALAIQQASEGLFDIRAGEYLVRSGLLPGHAVGTLTAPSGPCVGRKDHSAWRTSPHRLDLGGIAKGYAVDCALATLLGGGATEVLINAGGDMAHAGSQPVQIQLRDPASPGRIMHPISLYNRAMASSAVGRLQPRQHDLPPSIVHPVAGDASPKHGSGVTIMAPRCVHADALTKIVLLSRNPHHPALSVFSARTEYSHFV
ncbi:FAD:protein FMN transferase [Burkholderiaceae bacterium DAT-1]|nr:FAD:protein FMN transferase [Burkholderiaceae bacterium DAT-1]